MIEIQADRASLYRNNQDVELVNLLGRMMEKEQPSFIFLSLMDVLILKQASLRCHRWKGFDKNQ